MRENHKKKTKTTTFWVLFPSSQNCAEAGVHKTAGISCRGAAAPRGERRRLQAGRQGAGECSLPCGLGFRMFAE